VRNRHFSTTNDPNVNKRHLLGGAAQRTTHGGPFDPTLPTNGLYGSVVDTEPIAWPDVQGEIIGAGNIQPESVTADLFDTTAPAAPTDLALDTFVTQDLDGDGEVVIRVTWTPATDDDLNGVYIGYTDESVDDAGLDPDWTNEKTIFAGAEFSQFDIIGVRGAVQHWVRIRSVDLLGNRSDLTDAETIVSAADSDAPSVPTGANAVAGFRGAIFKWNPVAVSDLAEYEVRYAVDDGTGTAPETGNWVTVMTRTTVIWISGLEPDVRYWFEVGAIDRSGNHSGFTADDLATTSCVPAQVGAADIAANTISATHIAASGISADSIKSGLLSVGTMTGLADGIRIYDADATTADKLVGLWDENGIKVYASDDKLDYVHITEASVIVYKNGVAITAMTPDGIDASALTFGRLAGGHNLIPNSSFEVGAFSAQSTVGNGSFTFHTDTRMTKTGAVFTIDSGTW
jgi:hypothetical protein